MLLDVLAVLRRSPTRSTEDLAERLLTGPIGGGDRCTLRRLRRVLRRSSPDEDGAPGRRRCATTSAAAAAARARAPPGRAGRRACWPPGGAALAAGASAEDVLWAVWQATGLARRWERASARGGGSAAPRPTATSTPSSRCSTRPRASPTGCPARTPSSSPSTCARSRSRATRSPAARAEPDAVAVLTAHASKGLEWDLVCVADVQEGSWPDLRRRGSLLGTEALVDAVRGIDGQPAGLARAAAGRGAPAVLRRRHPGPAPAGGHRGRRRRGAAVAVPGRARPARGRARARTAAAGACTCPAWSPSCGPWCAPTDDSTPRRAPVPRPTAPPPRPSWPGSPRPACPAPTRTSGGGCADSQHRARASRDPDRPGAGQPVARRVVLRLRAAHADAATSACATTRPLAASLGTARARPRRRPRPERPAARGVRAAAWTQVWDRIDSAPVVRRQRARARASAMLQRLVTWLRDSRARADPRRRRGGLRGRPVGDAVLAGRVDRLERDARRPAGGRRPQDRQEQAASDLSRAPAARRLPAGDRARRVRRRRRRARRRACWCSSAPPGRSRAAAARRWPRPTTRSGRGERSTRVAARMRGHEFTATQNKRCHVCDVRTCCPLQVKGRQVTQ